MKNPTSNAAAEFRFERDTMGEVRLPKYAYFGPQTQRAVENFPVSGQKIPPELIHALGRVKLAAAQSNHQLGLFASHGRLHLSESRIAALFMAAQEVAEGEWDAEFPVDIYQTGSGTSSNMNANEVIAARAAELAGDDRFAVIKTIHPNDHVNCGQSTNDIFPTAIHVACAIGLKNGLVPALKKGGAILRDKSEEWRDVLKIGRTHLADATPMTLGQEVGGWGRQLELSAQRAESAIAALTELPVGGTAVGTGINTHRQFGGRVANLLAEQTGIPFVEATNHFEANAQRDGLVMAHGLIKSIAVSLTGVANNLRWLASGPRCGYYEIRLPDLQPGSSIMPGKVNPVLCESLMQVAARVIGNDTLLALAGASGGQFQLNIMMPVMADAVLESIRILTACVNLFADEALAPMEANVERCAEFVEQSLSMVTALNPQIGYEKAASLAKEAFATGKTIRQLCEEKNLLAQDQLDQMLDPTRMTRPME